MTDTNDSKNPVQYAEQKLCVHTVYEEAQRLIAGYEAEIARRVEMLSRVRFLREDIADREAELVMDERSSNPTMSANAFEPHIKLAKQNDPKLTELRRHLLDQQDEHDQHEALVDVLKRKIEVATARMVELGGLTSFYGAVKLASLSH